jgi:hypothetical protein
MTKRHTERARFLVAGLPFDMQELWRRKRMDYGWFGAVCVAEVVAVLILVP